MEHCVLGENDLTLLHKTAVDDIDHEGSTTMRRTDPTGRTQPDGAAISRSLTFWKSGASLGPNVGSSRLTHHTLSHYWGLILFILVMLMDFVIQRRSERRVFCV